MAGCHKYGEPARIFRPGLPSSALVTTTATAPLEFETKRVDGGRTNCGRAIGAFETKALSIPPDWKSVLRGMEPDDLLRAIHPNQKYQAFFAIGCAYKRAGGGRKNFLRLGIRLSEARYRDAQLVRLEQKWKRIWIPISTRTGTAQLQ